MDIQVLIYNLQLVELVSAHFVDFGFPRKSYGCDRRGPNFTPFYTDRRDPPASSFIGQWQPGSWFSVQGQFGLLPIICKIGGNLLMNEVYKGYNPLILALTSHWSQYSNGTSKWWFLLRIFVKPYEWIVAFSNDWSVQSPTRFHSQAIRSLGINSWQSKATPAMSPPQEIRP